MLIHKYPIYILFTLLLLFSLAKLTGLMINISPSMRLGFYIQGFGSIHRGDYIAFCLTKPQIRFGIQRGYLQKGKKCSGLSDPLIKEVIALPGDTVDLQNEEIGVNKRWFHYKTKNQDSQGQLLPQYSRGLYLNTQGYWVIGTNSAHSWDSRYFGPIAVYQILYKLKPLWVL